METGKNYFIRCLTFHYVGTLAKEDKHWLYLTNCSWVADSGRFNVALREGTLSEVETYPEGSTVLINRQAVVDAVAVNWPLPTESR